MPSAPLRLLALAAGAVHGLNTNTLLYGGANELKLLSAKYITSAGGSSAVFAGDNPNVKKQWSRFLYGDAPEEPEEPGRVRLLTTLDELGACLGTIDSLVLLCNDAPLDENVVGTLFSNLGEACERVVLVSRMGVTRAQPPGPFGFGGGDAALLATETAVRAAVAARGTAELSVVRIGTLKGGGPGNEEERGAPLGLTKAFDNSIVDLSAYMTSQAYDKYTLGLGLARGDPFDLSNPIVRAGRQGSPGRANHAPCPITHRAQSHTVPTAPSVHSARTAHR